jgi:hypothetical protein
MAVPTRKREGPGYGDQPTADLHWLRGWAERLRSELATELSHDSSFYFRPDALADDALLRFSDQHPGIVQAVREAQREVEIAYAGFAPGDAESARGLAGAMEFLLRRIGTAADAIEAELAPLAAATKREPAVPAGDRNDGAAGQNGDTIPQEHRTRLMSLADAGTLLRLQPESGPKAQRRAAAAKAIRRQMKPGGIRYVKVGTKFMFDKRQVPDE